MDKRQTELARHALGLDGGRTHSYRNCYVCSKDSAEHSIWLDMVIAGDAERRDGRKLPYGGGDLFHMTLSGARKAMLPGETLDREDFPAATTA